MLKGQARTDYMREYMRRRRSKKASAKAKPTKAAPDADTIARLTARNKELEAKAAQGAATIAKLTARNKELETILSTHVHILGKDPRAFVMPKKVHRQILGYLHPDRAPHDATERKKLEQCFQAFSALKVVSPNGA